MNVAILVPLLMAGAIAILILSYLAVPLIIVTILIIVGKALNDVLEEEKHL